MSTPLYERDGIRVGCFVVLVALLLPILFNLFGMWIDTVDCYFDPSLTQCNKQPAPVYR